MSRRALLWTIAGVAVAVVCVLAAVTAWTCDDALISFRYVRHWVGGDGLVFNIGERIEAFSNFLFVMLLAPFAAAHADLFTVANVLGIVATAVQVALLVWLLGRRGLPLVAVAFSAALFATDRIAVVWATGGLETATHGALVLAALALQLERPTAIRMTAVVHVALAASRPEGVMFAAIWFAHLLATRQTAELRRALNWFVPLVVALVAARLLYYGELVANPYRAKVSGVATLDFGPGYVSMFLRRMGLWGLAALATLPLLVSGLRTRPDRALLLGAAFVIAQLAMAAWTGGDYMTDFRILAPVVGVFYVVVGLLAARAWSSKTLAIVAMVAFAGGHAYRQLVPVPVFSTAPAPAAHKRILTVTREQPSAFARALSVFAEPGDSVLADWGGWMSYGHDLRTIDATGLVSKRITRDFYLRSKDEQLPGHARWPTIELMQREHLTFVLPKVNERPPEDAEINEQTPVRRQEYPFLHVTIPLEHGAYLRFFTTLSADELIARGAAKHVRVCFRPPFGALTCAP
ncbi:MAG TPA: hypothetical protein VMZ53_25560 [Kofleriaceae bacterium]|nr:hypothetical protein [Kofleriaceae bacterium]